MSELILPSVSVSKRLEVVNLIKLQLIAPSNYSVLVVFAHHIDSQYIKTLTLNEINDKLKTY